MARKPDADLGLGRPIERRDFLQGMLIGSGGALMGGLSLTLACAAALEAAAQDQPGYYPPERLGLRGSHPGSFEAAHALRDGHFWDHTDGIADTGETHDLIVVLRVGYLIDRIFSIEFPSADAARWYRSDDTRRY